jgi:hypothetical protein
MLVQEGMTAAVVEEGAMSAAHQGEYPHLPIVMAVVDQRAAAMTREEVDEARRRAAECGDYVTAERWSWHARLLAIQEDRDDRS